MHLRSQDTIACSTGKRWKSWSCSESKCLI